MYENQSSCPSGHGFYQRHLTKTEQIERLQQYAEELANELQAVKERIEKLK